MAEEKKLINIVPLEKEGWFLMRNIHNKHGLAAVETRPLSAIKVEEVTADQIYVNDPASADTAVATASETTAFYPSPVTRVKDEDGKWVCSNCGKKLGNQKPNYCSDCGGLFVYGEDAE